MMRALIAFLPGWSLAGAGGSLIGAGVPLAGTLLVVAGLTTPIAIRALANQGVSDA